MKVSKDFSAPCMKNIRSLKLVYQPDRSVNEISLTIPVQQVVGPNARLELPQTLKGSLNLWLLRQEHGQLDRNDAICIRVHDAAGVKRAFNQVVNWLAEGSDGMIRLASVRRARTSKTVKAEVGGVFYRKQYHVDKLLIDFTETHTLKLAASMLVEREGTHYAPRWYLRKRIHEQIHRSTTWPDDIEGGVFLDSDELWTALFKDFEQQVIASVDAREAKQRAARSGQSGAR